MNNACQLNQASARPTLAASLTSPRPRPPGRRPTGPGRAGEPGGTDGGTDKVARLVGSALGDTQQPERARARGGGERVGQPPHAMSMKARGTAMRARPGPPAPSRTCADGETASASPAVTSSAARRGYGPIRALQCGQRPVTGSNEHHSQRPGRITWREHSGHARRGWLSPWCCGRTRWPLSAAPRAGRPRQRR